MYSTPQRQKSPSVSDGSSPHVTPLLHHSPHLSPIVATRSSSNNHSNRSAPSPLLLTTLTNPNQPLPGIAEVSDENDQSFSYNHLTMHEDASLSFIESTPNRHINALVRDQQSPRVMPPPLVSRAPLTRANAKAVTHTPQRHLNRSDMVGETLNSISLLADDFLIDDFKSSFIQEEEERRARVAAQLSLLDKQKQRLTQLDLTVPMQPTPNLNSDSFDDLIDVKHVPKLNLLADSKPSNSLTASNKHLPADITTTSNHKQTTASKISPSTSPKMMQDDFKKGGGWGRAGSEMEGTVETEEERGRDRGLVDDEDLNERERNRRLIRFIQQKYRKSDEGGDVDRSPSPQVSPKPLPPNTSSKRWSSPYTPSDTTSSYLINSAERVKAHVRDFREQPPPNNYHQSNNPTSNYNYTQTQTPATAHSPNLPPTPNPTPNPNQSQSNLPIGSFYALILDQQQQPVLVPVRHNTTTTSPTVHNTPSTAYTYPQQQQQPPPPPRYPSPPPSLHHYQHPSSTDNTHHNHHNPYTYHVDDLQNNNNHPPPSTANTPIHQQKRFKGSDVINASLRSVSPVRARYAKYDRSVTMDEDDEGEGDERDVYNTRQHRRSGGGGGGVRQSSEFEAFSQVFYSAPLDLSMKVDHQYHEHEKHYYTHQHNHNHNNNDPHSFPTTTATSSSLHPLFGAPSASTTSTATVTSTTAGLRRSESPLLPPSSTLPLSGGDAGSRKRSLWKRLSSTPTRVSATSLSTSTSSSLSASASYKLPHGDYDDRNSEFWKYRLIRRDLTKILSPPRALNS